jgi:hypothetical protein
MACVLEFFVVLALISMSLAVMIGAVPPGEALRRVAVVLVLLFVAPVLLMSLIRSVIMPGLNGVVTVLGNATYIILVVGAIVLIGWLATQKLRRSGRTSGGREK